MTSHDSRLPDRSDANQDAVMTRLTADLDQVYGGSAAPFALRAEIRRLSLEQRVSAQDADRSLSEIRRPCRLPRSRRIAVGLGIAAILLLAGSALADDSLFEDAMNMFPGLSRITTQNLGAKVDLAQSVCGFTMTIDRAYADANRIVVAYSLTGPANQVFDNIAVEPSLEDSRGRPLQPVVGGGTGVRDNRNGNVITFNQPDPPLAGGSEQLRLTAASVGAEEVISGMAKPPASCESAAPVQTADGATTRQVTVSGPLSFNLDTPFDRRIRQASPNDVSHSAHGTTVTFDKIVVTPSETKVYLQASAVAAGAGGPAIAPVLYVDGKEIDPESTVDQSGEIVGTYDAALYDNHAAWSLKVLTDPVMTNNSRSYSDAVTFAVNLS